jgi:dihydrofolate reductase
VHLIKSFVVARSENNVIGCETGVPWALPTDLKLFRRLTLDHPIIMGRKTYESIGHALDRRDNIVVTRDPAFSAPGVTVARDRDSALECGAVAADRRRTDEIMIIGGAEIFRLFEGVVDLVYLTEIHARVEGNAWFDKDFTSWIDAGSAEINRPETDQYPFTFRVLVNPSSSLAKDFRRVSETWGRLPIAA